MLNRLKNERGMSLIEIMIVLGIIATASAAIVTNVMKGSAEARVKQTRATIEDIKAKVKMYKIDHGKMPSSLEDVYGEDVPKDGWNQDFQFEVPGSHGGKFDVWSSGEDEDTEDDDVVSWKKDEDSEE